MHIHKWSKWSEAKQLSEKITYQSGCAHWFQIRICVKCNKTEPRYF